MDHVTPAHNSSRRHTLEEFTVSGPAATGLEVGEPFPPTVIFTCLNTPTAAAVPFLHNCVVGAGVKGSDWC